MNILVIGNEVNRVETAQKFGVQHMYDFAESISKAKPGLKWADVIFDFVSAATPEALIAYEQISAPVFLDTTFTTLSAIVKAAGLKKIIFGFCGLPTFVNRELLEVSIANTSDEIVLKEWSVAVDTKYSLVKDQVGFITPRIICMIINEAYFTVEEGTATRGDIDLAMKLGTNYQFGPFEWAAKIGMQNVVRILDTAHRSSGDERYQACNLLRAEATV